MSFDPHRWYETDVLVSMVLGELPPRWRPFKRWYWHRRYQSWMHKLLESDQLLEREDQPVDWGLKRRYGQGNRWP